MKVAISGAEKLSIAAAAIRRAPLLAAQAGVVAANQVASRVITEASRDITDRYNLPASYVRERFRMKPGKAGNPVAVVSARVRPVRLARFDANQLTVVAKHPERAKGDALRGIASGRKAAGVSVNVVRANGRKAMPGAFMLPLRAGKQDGGNGKGIFIREGGKLVHRYGPSPHRAFAYWVKARRPDLQRMVAEAWAAEIQRKLKGRA